MAAGELLTAYLFNIISREVIMRTKIEGLYKHRPSDGRLGL
jgi:hypothetical protein